MKSFNETKRMIGFCQTDDFFLEYIQRLVAAGVIVVSKGDIIEEKEMVSDEFYERLCLVFGVLNDDKP
ncbi:hypothetical protein [Klebsiella oxytoca]|uniref:hypothetical protein n=1 Tax=Klebsiella oxytoca TaxID=571 RepID=UPI003A8DBE3C